MTYFKFLISFCFALLLFKSTLAQEPDTVPGFYDSLKISKLDSTAKLRVVSIHIIDNRKTKSYIILREVPFKTGDSLLIGNLAITLEQTRRQVFNTNLFSEVKVTPNFISAYEIELTITVREKWYIYPTPQFQFADRNINVWLKTYNADFNRVVYGIKFAHYNFSGRADQLRIYLLNGYSRNISFSYSTPYSNSKLTEGFTVSGGYSQNREIAYQTSLKNELLQFKKEGFVRNNAFATISYQSRKGFFKRNFYTLSYIHINVDDSIITTYNPNYLGKQTNSIGFPEFVYTFSYVNIDNVNYPLSGKAAAVTVVKRGLGFKGGINLLSVEGGYTKYNAYFNNRLFSSIQLYSKIKVPFKLAYINQRAIGYGEFYLRGQEYYVIDGIASAVAKFTLKKKILSFKIPLPFRIRQLPNIPFTFFAKTYADFGYSYAEDAFDSRFNNRLLYTGGFGLDILSVYGFTLNLEYSFNQLGENGLFLHGKGGF